MSFDYIDTDVLNEFLNEFTKHKSAYADICRHYNDSATLLLKQWKGYGASAFSQDTENIRADMNKLSDAMNSLYETLRDFVNTVTESDAELGKINRNSDT